MSKPSQPTARRTMAAPVALAVSVVSLLVLAVVGPAAHAQTNSPGGGQPTDAAPGPGQGGVSNQNGSNTGGDATAGNRSTPGQGGATGGGAGAPSSDDGGGASVVVPVLVVGVLLLIGAGIFVSGRQRRLERVEAT